ncbi:uncharacterized protein LOC111629347 [Centruroides sculpturatus]|uniref:uncharacterized protein LOC111629347 n=1 Tax=Centruroides sculpturatus TaxID=218467 RepID=UPI000C6DFFA2|nr:uncharacterized protein LOC111629347 [Centruroides sculpturatus]
MSTLMSQGVDSNNVNRLSSRIAFGIWLLMTAVLIWGYAGILTSFMALQTDEPVPNTFDELAEGIERREYTCVLIPHVYLDRYLKELRTKHARLFVTESKKHIDVMSAKVKRMKAAFVKKFFKNYVDREAKSHKEAKAFAGKLFTDILRKDRMVVIGTASAENLVVVAYGSNYVKSGDVLSTVYKGFAMRKGFPYKKQVNKLVRRIFETKIFKNEVFHVPSFEDAVKPLFVADLYGALGILVIGYSLSFACFLTEIVLGKFLK